MSSGRELENLPFSSLAQQNDGVWTIEKKSEVLQKVFEEERKKKPKGLDLPQIEIVLNELIRIEQSKPDRQKLDVLQATSLLIEVLKTPKEPHETGKLVEIICKRLRTEEEKLSLPMKRDFSNSSSENSDLDDLELTSSLSDDTNINNIGFTCGNCNQTVVKLQKYRNHISLKNSWCSRCKSVYFCNAQMKAHLVECQKLKIQRKNYREKRPWPRYLRGLEEHMKKKDQIHKETSKNEDLKKLETVPTDNF